MSNLLANPKESLAALAAALLVAYFILFFWLVIRHPKDAAILRADGKKRRSRFLTGPMGAAAVLAPMPYQIAVIALGISFLFFIVRSQHQRLFFAGATSGFLRKMAAVTGVAFGAFVAFGASVIIGAYHGAGS